MISKPTEAYPLAWPSGWKRTPASSRTRAKFNNKETRHGSWQDGTARTWTESKTVTISEGTERVLASLNRMGFNHSVVISSDLELRNDGLPRSGQRAPDDPGVTVYWGNGNKARCIAIDRYDRVADNLAAIAATLEAMRAIERHGGAAILERAFTGFTALPAPEQWFTILGVSSHASRDEIEDAYRRLAMKHHPDRGGDAGEMARINSARDDGLGARA